MSLNVNMWSYIFRVPIMVQNILISFLFDLCIWCDFTTLGILREHIQGSKVFHNIAYIVLKNLQNHLTNVLDMCQFSHGEHIYATLH